MPEEYEALELILSQPYADEGVKTILHNTQLFKFVFRYCDSKSRETLISVTKLAEHRIQGFDWNDAVVVCNKIRNGGA